MLTGGRFFVSGTKEEYISEIKEKVFNQKVFGFSREMIEKVQAIIKLKQENTNKVSTYGLAQKIVNMSFKYFYIFYQFLEKDYIIDFTNCDCP